MTQGEEGFIDANHNGLLDTNEVFFDLGDPFIDANDNGQYDQIYPGGPWEVRFCGYTSRGPAAPHTGGRTEGGTPSRPTRCPPGSCSAARPSPSTTRRAILPLLPR